MSGGHILLSIVGAAAALAMLVWPGRSAVLLLVFAPIIWALGAANLMTETTAASINLAVVVAGVATLMYARFLLMRQKDPLLIWLRRATIAYCAGTLPSVFTSRLSIQSVGGYVRLISPVIFMFAVLHCSPPRGLRTPHFKALALSTTSMLGIIVAAQYAGQSSWYLGGFERLRAFALGPQHISLYSVITVGVLVCGVLLRRRPYLYLTGIFALLICTYLTGFRTAWIGMGSLIALVMVVAVRSPLAKFVACLVGLSLLGVSGVIVQSLARYAYGNDIMSVDVLDAIASGRITTDYLALERYLRGNPVELLFGIGGVYSSEQATLEEGTEGAPVHGDVLATLIECGIVSLLGYLFFNITIAWILLRMMRYLPRQHTARTFVAVGLACFIAFTIMGIAGALYTNVFVGFYYYAFIGFVFAQLKRINPSLVPLLSESYLYQPRHEFRGIARNPGLLPTK